MTTASDRLHAAATDRNREPILAALAPLLPEDGLVLEIASGTGQHAAWFAPRLPGLTWQPSDIDDANLASIAAWTAGLPNVRPPLRLDVSAADWPANPALRETGAIYNANMIHISPWAACEGLLAGAAARLPPDGPLILYGPFRRGGRHTSQSNADFDFSLRQRDPAWGVRDLETVAAAADIHGLALAGTTPMPANNLTVVFRRRA